MDLGRGESASIEANSEYDVRFTPGLGSFHQNSFTVNLCYLARCNAFSFGPRLLHCCVAADEHHDIYISMQPFWCWVLARTFSICFWPVFIHLKLLICALLIRNQSSISTPHGFAIMNSDRSRAHHFSGAATRSFQSMLHVFLDPGLLHCCILQTRPRCM